MHRKDAKSSPAISAPSLAALEELIEIMGADQRRRIETYQLVDAAELLWTLDESGFLSLCLVEGDLAFRITLSPDDASECGRLFRSAAEIGWHRFANLLDRAQKTPRLLEADG